MNYVTDDSRESNTLRVNYEDTLEVAIMIQDDLAKQGISMELTEVIYHLIKGESL